MGPLVRTQLVSLWAGSSRARRPTAWRLCSLADQLHEPNRIYRSAADQAGWGTERAGMTAIFGILGETDRHELEAMAHRLAPRGACFEIWEPAPDVHLGVGHRSSAELTSSSGLPI